MLLTLQTTTVSASLTTPCLSGQAIAGPDSSLAYVVDEGSKSLRSGKGIYSQDITLKADGAPLSVEVSKRCH